MRLLCVSAPAIIFAFFLNLCAWADPELPRDTRAKALNPDVSVNFLGLFLRGTGLSNDPAQVPHNGLSFQESELQFTADVDPYFRGVALFSIAQESGDRGFGIDPEEVYAESISLPAVTVRAGKFKLALGRHNLLHLHAFPFINAPLINERLLGDEGLSEPALSAAFLLPASWFSELSIQAFTPGNETLYGSSSSGDTGGLVHLKNLWDLSDDLTLELGLSGTAGHNQFERTSIATGADLTFKWRPAVGGKYRALIWSSEYLNASIPGLATEEGEAQDKLGGLASWVQYQFAERWWIQGRYDYLGLPHSESIAAQHRESILLGFFPSEFSGLRLQYDLLNTANTDKPEHTIALQFNMSIGAHPAHQY